MVKHAPIVALIILFLILGLIAGYLLRTTPPVTTIYERETITSKITITVTEFSTLTLTLSRVETITISSHETGVAGVGAGAVKAICITRLMGGCASLLIDLISRANKSIYIMMYGFTLDKLADALINAAGRGVEVKVLIESESTSWKGSEHEKLIAHGISLKLDPNPNLMHHKVMIIDGRIVVTGSYNWTWSAEKENDENMVVIDDPAIASVYEKEFWRLWSQGLSE